MGEDLKNSFTKIGTCPYLGIPTKFYTDGKIVMSEYDFKKFSGNLTFDDFQKEYKALKGYKNADYNDNLHEIYKYELKNTQGNYLFDAQGNYITESIINIKDFVEVIQPTINAWTPLHYGYAGLGCYWTTYFGEYLDTYGNLENYKNINKNIIENSIKRNKKN